MRDSSLPEHYPRLERRTSIRIAPKGSVIITAAAWIAELGGADSSLIRRLLGSHR